jgi:hypothetical protein
MASQVFRAFLPGSRQQADHIGCERMLIATNRLQLFGYTFCCCSVFGDSKLLRYTFQHAQAIYDFDQLLVNPQRSFLLVLLIPVREFQFLHDQVKLAQIASSKSAKLFK